MRYPQFTSCHGLMLPTQTTSECPRVGVKGTHPVSPLGSVTVRADVVPSAPGSLLCLSSVVSRERAATAHLLTSLGTHGSLQQEAGADSQTVEVLTVLDPGQHTHGKSPVLGSSPPGMRHTWAHPAGVRGAILSPIVHNHREEGWEPLFPVQMGTQSARAQLSTRVPGQGVRQPQEGLA